MVLGLCVVLAAVELYRTRSRSLVPFLIAVVGGEEILATLIKNIVDRTPAGVESCRRNTRPVLSERSLDDRGSVLRRGGAPPRAAPFP